MQKAEIYLQQKNEEILKNERKKELLKNNNDAKSLANYIIVNVKITVLRIELVN